MLRQLRKHGRRERTGPRCASTLGPEFADVDRQRPEPAPVRRGSTCSTTRVDDDDLRQLVDLGRTTPVEPKRGAGSTS